VNTVATTSIVPDPTHTSKQEPSFKPPTTAADKLSRDGTSSSAK